VDRAACSSTHTPKYRIISIIGTFDWARTSRPGLEILGKVLGDGGRHSIHRRRAARGCQRSLLSASSVFFKSNSRARA
jgi:hypothetical protein